MKSLWFPFFFCLQFFCRAQDPHQTKYVFLVTTDGFRWQEVFGGADSSLINDPSLVSDTGLIKAQFWDDDFSLRRKMLMPFLWKVVAKQGALFGNRALNNNVNVKNFYRISYPGYNELLSGFADPRPNFNQPVYNRNINILEFLDLLDAHHGKVAAFSSWNLFPYILNEPRNGLPVNSGYETMKEDADTVYREVNLTENSINGKGHTRFDGLTFLNAMEYVKKNKPHVTFIGLGETDEFAHGHRYDRYLQQANAVDKMISDLWYFIQTSPFYRNKTTLLVTTDHGRGKKPAQWDNHGFWVPGSGQTWLAMIGPDIQPLGELESAGQIYANQVAATIAWLLDTRFVSNHKTGEHLALIPAKRETREMTVATVEK